MSQENVERLRAAYDYTARTGELQRELLHPEFVCHPEFVWDLTTFRGAILPGTYEGVDGANRFLAEWLEGFEQRSLDIEEVFDRGDRVVAVVRQRAKTQRGGPDVEVVFAHVWTFRGDLAVRAEMYADRDEALGAAGLRE
jgi:ketosteroid isomerase-like protein